MNDKEIGEIGRKLHEIDPSGKLLNEFFYADDKDAWIKNAGGRLEGYRTYTDVYKNLEDFMANKYKVMNDLYTQLGGVKPSDARMYSINQKYKNIDRDELNEWFDKTNKYKEDIIKERQQKADVARRKKEVEGTYTDRLNPEEAEARNWGILRNVLTSDYEKERYIHEPEKALFGYDAPSIGEAPETRWGSIADLGIGAAAAAADFNPIGRYTFVAGPALRSIRDIAHNVSDSRYKKDLPSIIATGTTDLGINSAAKYLANLRKGQRIVNQMTDDDVSKYLNATESFKNTRKAVGELQPGDILLKYDSDIDLVNKIKSLPESNMKNQLMAVVNDTYVGKPINREAINDIVSRYSYITNEGGLDNAVKFVRGETTAMPKYGNDQTLKDFIKEQSYAPKYDELTKGQKLSVIRNKLIGNLNKGDLGQIGVQETANIKGRDIGKVKSSEDKLPYDINDYVKDYTRFFEANFVPNEKEGDPLWEAYKIWLRNKERGK